MSKDATKAAFVAYLKENGARDLDSIRAAARHRLPPLWIATGDGES